MPDDKTKAGDAGGKTDDKTNAGGSGGDAGDKGSKGTPDFDTWAQDQPEDVRGLIDGHVHGLKSALERTKDEKKQLRTELEEIRRSKDLDADAKLSAYEEKLEAAEQRAAFYESVPKDLRNPKAAYILARESGALRRDGSLDVEKFRQEFPELFETAKNAPSNAGAGAGDGGGTKGTFNMSQWIRTQARR